MSDAIQRLRSASSKDSILDREVIAQIRSLTDGDSFFPDLVSCFLEDAQVLLDRLASADGASDARLIPDICHSMRSAAGSVGGLRLSKFSGAALALDADELSRARDELHAALSELLREVEQAFKDSELIHPEQSP